MKNKFTPPKHEQQSDLIKALNSHPVPVKRIRSGQTYLGDTLAEYQTPISEMPYSEGPDEHNTD